MRNESSKVVAELVAHDCNVIAVTADNGNDIYHEISVNHPDQYIDYGISECNMIASAAGMASTGKIPFLYAVTNFMSMRAFEFIRNIVCVSNYNVKMLGRSAGLAGGNMGMTHQGTEDLGILRTLPNLLVITPATPLEARWATYEAYRYNGSVYIRLEACREPELYDRNHKFTIGKGSLIRNGSDFTVITIGSIVNEAIQAASILQKERNINIRVLSLSTIKPIDEDIILQAAEETGYILTLEEHSIHGGLGSAVAEILAEKGVSVCFKRMGMSGYSKGAGDHGNIYETRFLNGLSYEFIIKNIETMMNGVNK